MRALIARERGSAPHVQRAALHDADSAASPERAARDRGALAMYVHVIWRVRGSAPRRGRRRRRGRPGCVMRPASPEVAAWVAASLGNNYATPALLDMLSPLTLNCVEQARLS